jgi:hypothetical protein
MPLELSAEPDPQPASWESTRKQEAKAHCWMGLLASERLQLLLKAGRPQNVADGHYVSSNPEDVASMTAVIAWWFGIFEAVQSMLISASVASDLMFVTDLSKPRTRTKKSLRLASEFPELSGIDLHELMRTDARDALIHALPRLRKLFERTSKDGPAYVAMWSLGPAQGRPDILRSLDPQTLVLTIDGQRADLHKLVTEMMVVRDRIQTKAMIGNPGGPSPPP